ncbi:Uncharacterized membrane protein YkvA, DUF1232 family [Quadrisphaera granulorum]|uniref:Uncharacterized membrane protein YkvA (DUF1232 family) n=1 Tax=Quadrisphaera granulorum TaxID=317664 RepID=A0A315ZVI3_9ACTN|nr:YkvA family protein [Quadrisphaera granulorum]PWJ49262.1 uncharacterized membrane protein YkvA (DUF1232 family) [Quadrisphaera granulorum]SZE98179.1 Uncharacterized membrane protein YkvA, DUF1232 family [Quadrisphaera granulorum]
MSGSASRAARNGPGAFRVLWWALRRRRRRGSPGTTTLLGSLPRLVTAVLSGQYTGCSRGRLALMAAAAAYVVSPADLLPEGLLGPIGLTDDAAVLAWLTGALLSEGEAFLAWEREQRTAGAPGAAGTPGAASHRTRRGRGGRPDVVPGDVLS